MNIVLWILQILLALHTTMGAVWKLSHSEQSVPSLTAIPHGLWLAMSIVEIICSLALILPLFRKRLGRLPAVAAICIASEMLMFSGLSVFAHSAESKEITYWLIVAAVCAFIVYGRFSSKQLGRYDKQTASSSAA
jgi:predicted membrane protein